MIAVAASSVVVTAIAAPVAGCGGPSVLVKPRPKSTAGREYLAALDAEQRRLAGAERSIPTRPRTPAAFSRSIALLGSAVARLADGIGRLTPPASVSLQHRRLIAIMRSLAANLRAAAAEAVRPQGELRAASALLSATTAASAAFSATVAEIDQTLSK